MLGTAAALALVWAMIFPASGDPVSYEAAVAADPVVQTTVPTNEGSSSATSTLSDEQQAMMDAEPSWHASATLYHAGGGGATGNDSLGCRPIAMRTVAVDPKVIPRHTRLFIPQTVGMRMPDGSLHDGYWYASDTGGAIKGARVDLYTGYGRASMNPAMRFNRHRLTIVDAGHFDGCPPTWDHTPSQATMMASANTAVGAN